MSPPSTTATINLFFSYLEKACTNGVVSNGGGKSRDCFYDLTSSPHRCKVVQVKQDKMGISAVVGTNGALLFLAFIYFKDSGMGLALLPLLHASLVSFLVAIASHPSVNLPLLLGKSSDGSFPLWSMLVFAPFLAFARIYVYVKRLIRRRTRKMEPSYTEVSDGLYVGGWPSSSDSFPPGEPAIIDCTCELPRSSKFYKNSYMCIPTWDTRSPQPSDIESAVLWACRQRAQKKPIYIHCAFGHGRSVCVMCAVLVALGIAEDWKAAEKIAREKRPFIRMNAIHRRNLKEWSTYRLSFKRRGKEDVSSVILTGTS